MEARSRRPQCDHSEVSGAVWYSYLLSGLQEHVSSFNGFLLGPHNGTTDDCRCVRLVFAFEGGGVLLFLTIAEGSSSFCRNNFSKN